MAAHQLTLSVPADPSAVTAARQQAVAAIRRWTAERDHEVVHTAALLISELLTNAVRYASPGPVRLTVRRVGAVLRMEVRDSSPVLPRPGPPDGLSENGRGLVLVAALADRHGVQPTPTGKQCWAEIALTTPDHEITPCLPLSRS